VGFTRYLVRGAFGFGGGGVVFIERAEIRHALFVGQAREMFSEILEAGAAAVAASRRKAIRGSIHVVTAIFAG
jgi:hypothetical protein